MIPHDRLVAPREHLGVLIEPPICAIPPDLEPQRAATKWNGQSIRDVRESLLRELGLRGPIIATGHQAEFFHAGVFAKTLAADLLAESFQGTSVFVCVDSDTPKSNRVAVPLAEQGVAERHFLPIPGLNIGLPVESQQAVSPGEWADFFARMETLAARNTLLREYSKSWLTGGDGPIVFRDAVLRAQAAIEASLGFEPAKPLHISRLAETGAFRAFAGRIVANAADFARAYNLAKLNYRKRHRVRSAHNPVTDLETVGERVETPFWVLKPGGPRLRLWVAVRDDKIAFFADQQPIGEELIQNVGRSSAAQDRWNLEDAGWRIRPTVITLSAFCRIFLCDTFVHGIGGAKYDEITDELLESWFRVSAAPMMCVTATALLSLALKSPAPRPIGTIRESQYNPQRFWNDLPRDLIELRQRQIETVIGLRSQDRLNRAARRLAFKELRETTERLGVATQPQRDRLADAWATFDAVAAQQAIARDREYFFALHTRDTMLALIGRLRTALAR